MKNYKFIINYSKTIEAINSYNKSNLNLINEYKDDWEEME